MKINERGYWENRDDEGHRVDPNLASALLGFFVGEMTDGELSILDIGCGTGYYTRMLNQPIYRIFCAGYDGNPNTEALSGGLCGVADFTQPQELGIYDWVLSLEVGEHIPAKYETAFINNLHKHNRSGIVLSWAIKGQGGDGHVNCHDNEYIKAIFADLGYINDLEAEQELRYSASSCYWFADTIMVFRRRELCWELFRQQARASVGADTSKSFSLLEIIAG